MLQNAVINQSLNLRETAKCIALWKGVILQALLDLKSVSNKKMAKIHRRQASKWINLHNTGFIRVCALAELDPRYVYAHKLNIIEEREKKLKQKEQEENDVKNSIQADSHQEKRQAKTKKAKTTKTSKIRNKKADKEIQSVA